MIGAKVCLKDVCIHMVISDFSDFSLFMQRCIYQRYGQRYIFIVLFCHCFCDHFVLRGLGGCSLPCSVELHGCNQRCL